jgi:hypothetical protein
MGSKAFEFKMLWQASRRIMNDSVGWGQGTNVTGEETVPVISVHIRYALSCGGSHKQMFISTNKSGRLY